MNPLVFARCADSVEQGRRLENLSWRLWTRETFLYDGDKTPAAPSTTSLPTPINYPHRSSASEEVPQLSGSVESIADDEAVEFTSESAPVDIVRPRIRRQDSCTSSRSRGKERHITSDNLEKMVVSIVHKKEPLTAPLPDITAFPLPPLPEKDVPLPVQMARSGSTTTSNMTESPDKASQIPSLESIQPASSPETQSRRPTVIRGFSPSQIPTNRVISPALKVTSPPSIPEPQEAPAPRIVQSKKQQPTFALGASSCDDSYSDRGHSLETRKQPVPQAKKKIFQVGGSSEEESSLKSALHSSRPNPLLATQKKQTSFSNQVVTRTIPTVAVDDNEQSETDYVDESAIDDDDDSSDWEDSNEESGKSSVDDKTLFQRVDSKANLTTRRSLITLMLAQNERDERIQRLGNNASQSTSAIPRARTSPNGPSVGASPEDSDEAPLMMKRGAGRATTLRPINEVPRSVAQPIMTTNHFQPHAALSPRTTRRNMLATELTESLRRHLLWERSQKTQTANAVLKRRHTSQDVANLKQYPEKPFMKKVEDVNAGSWDQYLSKDAYNGYHSKGW